MGRGVMVGLATLALLPAVPDSASHTLSHERPAASQKAEARSYGPANPQAAAGTRTVPTRGSLIICVRGVDTFVSAAGTGAVGGNLSFGVRDGECRRESVPSGRYLVRLQGGHPSACSGAIAFGSCEIGRPRFSYVEVFSTKQSSMARVDQPKADVNVPNGGTTKVAFVFHGPHL